VPQHGGGANEIGGRLDVEASLAAVLRGKPQVRVKALAVKSNVILHA
jgi:hypothetical protein